MNKIFLFLFVFMAVSCAKTVYFQTANYPDLYISSKEFMGVVKKIEAPVDLKEAKFRIVPGLADKTAVSFESVYYPKHYLRHQYFQIKLHEYSTEDLFKKDATFKMEPGFTGGKSVSFEACFVPGFYIRHRFNMLFITTNDNELFTKDASFILTSGVKINK